MRYDVHESGGVGCKLVDNSHGTWRKDVDQYQGCALTGFAIIVMSQHRV